MPIGVAGAALFAAAGCLARWRSTRDRTWLVVGLMAISGTGLAIARYGLRLALVAGPVTGSLLVASLVLGALFWASALGLPRPVALLLGIGLTSRTLRFSDRVRADWLVVSASINRAIEDPEGRSVELLRAEAGIRRMRTYRAPDPQWGEIRDELADGHQEWIDLLRRGATPEAWSEQVRTFDSVSYRWQAMVEDAAADQRSLATPARRRRGRAVWLAVPGFALLVTAAAAASTDGLLTRGLADLGVWIDVIGLVGALALLTAAIAVVFAPGRSRDIQ